MKCPLCNSGPVFSYICEGEVNMCKEQKAGVPIIPHYHATCLACGYSFVASKEEAERREPEYFQPLLPLPGLETQELLFNKI